MPDAADSHGVVVLDYDRITGACAADGAALLTDLQVVCLHSKTSPTGTGSCITSDHRVLSFDDPQWPRVIRLTGPEGEEDLSVPDDGAPVLARELAEVCRLVTSGARESDLHPLAASVAAADVLSRARRRPGARAEEPTHSA